MSSHTFQNWWQQYREAVRCSNLREELRLLLYGCADNEDATIERLIVIEQHKQPGKLESWYLDRAIDNLRRRSEVNRKENKGTQNLYLMIAGQASERELIEIK
ncbi:MAG: hypothetical protein AAF383_09710 [Cyanobacteria bacterium P01_A01_bin.83]